MLDHSSNPTSQCALSAPECRVLSVGVTAKVSSIGRGLSTRRSPASHLQSGTIEPRPCVMCPVPGESIRCFQSADLIRSYLSRGRQAVGGGKTHKIGVIRKTVFT